jgi:hypothetical protein
MLFWKKDATAFLPINKLSRERVNLKNSTNPILDIYAG